MTQTQKTLGIALGIGVFLFLALLAGIFFAGTPRPESEADPKTAADTPAKMPSQTQDALIDRLTMTQTLLQSALDALNRATGNNKGGYEVKARADVTRAVLDIGDAIDYIKNHPEAAALPTPEKHLDISSEVRVGHNHNAAPNLSTSLDFLNSALDQLHKTSGGDLGGFRDKVLTDIQLAASDTATGITIAADGRRTTTPATRPIPLTRPDILTTPATRP